jgi:hypothetical protein
MVFERVIWGRVGGERGTNKKKIVLKKNEMHTPFAKE